MAGMECADLPAVMSDDSIRWCGRLWVAAGGVAASAAQPLGESEPLEPGTAAFYTNLGISVALIITAGLMAGLTMVSHAVAASPRLRFAPPLDLLGFFGCACVPARRES